MALSPCLPLVWHTQSTALHSSLDWQGPLVEETRASFPPHPFNFRFCLPEETNFVYSHKIHHPPVCHLPLFLSARELEIIQKEGETLS